MFGVKPIFNNSGTHQWTVRYLFLSVPLDVDQYNMYCVLCPYRNRSESQLSAVCSIHKFNCYHIDVHYDLLGLLGLSGWVLFGIVPRGNVDSFDLKQNNKESLSWIINGYLKGYALHLGNGYFFNNGYDEDRDRNDEYEGITSKIYTLYI